MFIYMLYDLYEMCIYIYDLIYNKYDYIIDGCILNQYVYVDI